MAIAEIAELFPPDADEAAAVLDECVPGSGVVAEEKLFASGIGGESRALCARRDSRVVGVAVTSSCYLRVLAVEPSARGVGIGSLLLEEACADIRRRKSERVRVLAEPGNYLAPGIEDSELVAWFERRGFFRTGENTNLVVPVVGNDKITESRQRELSQRCQARGYLVERAVAGSRAELIEFAGGFGEAWAIEVARALSGSPPGVHIARTTKGSIAAFAAHDGNNAGLGWFGPAATAEEHRGKGLGEALLVACLVDVAAAGHDVCNIAWIGPREFYRRAVGIESERNFTTMEKTL